MRTLLCFVLLHELSARSCPPRARSFHCLGGSPNPPSLEDYEKKANNTACGFCQGAGSTEYFGKVAERIRRRSASRCSELVVYSAALGSNFAATQFPPRILGDALAKEALWRANGKNCYIRFVLDDVPKNDGSDVSSLVHLDPTKLPYVGSEMRRNVKVLKMLGSTFFFPWAKRTVWIDAKLRIGSMDPALYFESHVEEFGVCATYVGLPLHRNAYGDSFSVPSLKRHGETILRAASRRPAVTDSLEVVAAQIAEYAEDDAALSGNLVDTAYIARDFSTPRCRALNHAFGCAWFDEIDCFSDRDQLSFPVALRRLGLRSDGNSEEGLLLDSHNRPAVYIAPPGSKAQPRLHWYFSTLLAVGKCVLGACKTTPLFNSTAFYPGRGWRRNTLAGA